MELIFTQPYVKIKFLIDAGIAERQTASGYLRTLEQIGVLASEQRGRDSFIGIRPCWKYCPHDPDMSTFCRFLDISLKHVHVMDISDEVQ